MRVLLLHFRREKMHQAEVSPAPARMHPALRPALLLPCCLQLHPWVPIPSIHGIIIRIQLCLSPSVSFPFFFFFIFLRSPFVDTGADHGERWVNYLFIYLVCSLRMNLCFGYQIFNDKYFIFYKYERFLDKIDRNRSNKYILIEEKI